MDPALNLDCAVHFGSAFHLEARVSLGGDPGHVTALFGPSGCGKTTILRLLAGLLAPTSGSIRCGQDIWADASRGYLVPPQQRQIGFLFQSYALFPHLRVRENLGYALRRWPKEEREHRVRELGEMLEIDHLLDHWPAQLSGGQAQRVALGRALAPRPRWLLLDEPLSALDQPLRSRLGAELRHLLSQSGIPSVVVTHERTELDLLGDEVVLMRSGKVLQQGSVREVCARPETVEAARLLGFENVWDVRIPDGVGASEVELANGQRLVLAQATPERVTFRRIAVAAEHIQMLAPDAVGPGSNNVWTARLIGLKHAGPLLELRFAGEPAWVVRTTPQWVASHLPKLGDILRLRVPPEAIVPLKD